MRIVLGGQINVTATERWYSEVRAGRAFMRGTHVAAAAGALGEVQLFNPAASGITVIVRRATSGALAADRHQVRQYDTALGTLVGTGFNLLSGGAAAAAVIRTATPAAADGTLISEMRLPADALGDILDDWSWELGAGEGVLIVGTTANQVIDVTYFWIEVA